MQVKPAPPGEDRHCKGDEACSPDMFGTVSTPLSMTSVPLLATRNPVSVEEHHNSPSWISMRAILLMTWLAHASSYYNCFPG